MISHLEPDILECEVKWALGSITMNKASGGDGIPVELFQILKDVAVKLLHSICQQTHRKHNSQWWKNKSISSKIRRKTKMFTLSTFIQHSFGSCSHSNQRRKRERNPNWKRSRTVTACDLYYVEVGSFYAHFFFSYHEWVLNSVKSFLLYL